MGRADTGERAVRLVGLRSGDLVNCCCCLELEQCFGIRDGAEADCIFPSRGNTDLLSQGTCVRRSVIETLGM